MARDGHDRVGPRSWYWPTRYKILVGFVIAIAILVLFVLVNPGPGHAGP